MVFLDSWIRLEIGFGAVLLMLVYLCYFPFCSEFFVITLTLIELGGLLVGLGFSWLCGLGVEIDFTGCWVVFLGLR